MFKQILISASLHLPAGPLQPPNTDMFIPLGSLKFENIPKKWCPEPNWVYTQFNSIMASIAFSPGWADNAWTVTFFPHQYTPLKIRVYSIYPTLRPSSALLCLRLFLFLPNICVENHFSEAVSSKTLTSVDVT